MFIKNAQTIITYRYHRVLVIPKVRTVFFKSFATLLFNTFFIVNCLSFCFLGWFKVAIKVKFFIRSFQNILISTRQLLDIITALMKFGNTY